MIFEPARAKLNLALHVRGRRDDGYHDLETLFAFAAEGDELRVAEAEAPSFTVTGPFGGALAGEGDNLVTRARDAFAATFGALPPLAITLDKRLPVASGIGGGSADAAATLRALARVVGVAADEARLFAIAEILGSDVPACLAGVTAIGRGRGERLEPVPGAEHMALLLVNPGVAVSTRDVFARWDGIDRGPLAAGDVMTSALAGRNDLQSPALAIAPVIGDVLDRLDGALLARMSGSGATCFALYEHADDRAVAAAAIRSARPDWWCLETVLA